MYTQKFLTQESGQGEGAFGELTQLAEDVAALGDVRGPV
jgi:hypothetical protein